MLLLTSTSDVIRVVTGAAAMARIELDNEEEELMLLMA